MTKSESDKSTGYYKPEIQEIMDNTVKVEDIDSMWNSTRIKMKKLEDQVQLLKLKMDELRTKFSRPEPQKIGSEVPDVTLVCRDEKQISSHRVVVSSNSPVLLQHNTINITVSAVVKKDNKNKCGDVTLVCDNDKKVHAHKIVLSLNSSDAKKKNIEVVNFNVTLAPEDGNQPKNHWLCIRDKIFQSSEGCQCYTDEFLHQYPVVSPPSPAQCQNQGFSRQHKDHYSHGQVFGECYMKEVVTTETWKVF